MCRWRQLSDLFGARGGGVLLLPGRVLLCVSFGVGPDARDRVTLSSDPENTGDAMADGIFILVAK
jgi:hypothetical protein